MQIEAICRGTSIAVVVIDFDSTNSLHCMLKNMLEKKGFEPKFAHNALRIILGRVTLQGNQQAIAFLLTNKWEEEKIVTYLVDISPLRVILLKV